MGRGRRTDNLLRAADLIAWWEKSSDRVASSHGVVSSCFSKIALLHLFFFFCILRAVRSGSLQRVTATMMRRCVSASVFIAVPGAVRHQSSGNGGRSGNNRGSRPSSQGIHTFIRDNQTPSYSAASPRHGSGTGGTQGSGRATSPHSSVPSGDDWASQLQRELYREEDPLGGMAHKDYYRDPATGYSPQYAPRNFAHGGEVAYSHPQSENYYRNATAQRQWTDHDVSQLQSRAREARATSRSFPSAAERDAFINMQIPLDRFASHIPENTGLGVMDQLRHATVTSAEKLREQTIVNRHQHVGQRTSVTSSTMSPPEMVADYVDQAQAAADDTMDEHLRIAYGLREKERADFAVMQRTSRLNFGGYDMDRFAAQQQGKPYGAQQLPPNTQPCSVMEAQKVLRSSASVPSVEVQVSRAYARNTVTDSPKLGEALTSSVVDGIRANREVQQEEKVQQRQKRFGLGRQSALVQDPGPDNRTLKKHTHDERFVNAAAFVSDAYRTHTTDEHVNPYRRGNTEKGVGHLLQNHFDIERREDRISKGRQDITERNTIHLGTPIHLSVDEFVFRHRNARGERPLDYFRPFPGFRANRLTRMYRDTEGFSAMKQRPDFLEWELFTRYRAHHQQRRELALRHGLEPVANETAQERDARRAKLDALCEVTPFDESKMSLNDDEVKTSVETLRSWFGVYFLPTPTIVELVNMEQGGTLGLHLHHRTDALGTVDTREHVISSRYLNKLLLSEGYQHRLSRGFVADVLGKAKEPVITYAQPPEVLKHFSAEEMVMYNDYVKSETERQLAEWSTVMRRRRFIAEKQLYGEVVPGATPQLPVSVTDVQDQESGAVLTVATANFADAIAEAMSSTKGILNVDGRSCKLIPGTERRVQPLTVKLESGELIETTDEEFQTYPLESDASASHQHALNYGIADYHYNRGNYVETQDVIWEEATTKGEEGWSPATHADGLRPGLPVRARRRLNSSSGDDNRFTSSDASIVGDYQRGHVVEYLHQPFFNPEPRLVSIAFGVDGVVEQIPLANVMIWQRQHYGPDRTNGDQSRRHNAAGLRRYVDVTDPKNEKVATTEHFLDKYESRHTATESQTAKYRSVKQVSELDQWTSHDTRRPENYRPLSISHRRDYVRGGYFHRYTPWEWIAIQEADQPIVHETIRQDNVGQSRFFSLNRYWRYKARPHGYMRNYENEVRDMFQFVDGVTPWRQAQKIRTYWEVREHHPMPQFNRPEVAMHRNTAGLLPTHLWDVDKKTGKVKGVRDSVRDYQTKTPLPNWVQL